MTAMTKILIQVMTSSLLLVVVSPVDVDKKGYLVYCPCMGRFGNQADHFLGVLSFAKALDRTLILPPWVEYRFPNPKSVQVPFDTYFDVDFLSKSHRVITMEKFMKELAPTIWPPEERTVLCYQARMGSKKENDCNAKDGNPFGPFWDTFNIDFVSSEFYGPLHHDTTNLHDVERWKKRFPPEKYRVLAFTGAPASFPVQQSNLRNQQYLTWSKNIKKKAQDFISKNIPEGPFVGIHLRLGSDFKRACEHVKETPALFASAQCVGYRGEHGKTTEEMCYPSDETIIKQVKKAVKSVKAKGVFVATDSRDLVDKLSKAIKKVKFAKLSDPSPHLDLAILGMSDHFIGNCVSTFTAFVKRERDASNKPSEFWAFKKDRHDEL